MEFLVWRASAPDGEYRPVVIDTLEELLRFVEEHGSVVVEQKKKNARTDWERTTWELIIRDDYLE